VPSQNALGGLWESVVRIRPCGERVRRPSQSFSYRRRKEVAELFAVVAPVSLVGAAIVAWTQLRRW